MSDAGAIDALTEKVNELAHICAGLSKENAELRSQLSALSAQVVPSRDQAFGSGVDGTPSESTGPGWPGEVAGAAQFSRRAVVGVALAGAAAGIAGMTAVTERGTRPSAPDATAHAVAIDNPAAVELTAAAQAAAVQAAAPTATGSVIAATLSTASPVLAATNTSVGAGVAGTSTGPGPGVAGTNTSTAAGVAGTNTSTGPGVHATSSRGRGGIFAGSAAAQIQLTPGTASHPKSGQRGDLYADGSGRLWFCKTTGATATWHQIA